MPTYRNTSNKTVTVQSLGGHPITFGPGERKAIVNALLPHPDIVIEDDNPMAQDVAPYEKIAINAGSTYTFYPAQHIPANVIARAMIMYHLGDNALNLYLNGSTESIPLPPSTEIGFVREELDNLHRIDIENPGGSVIYLTVIFLRYKPEQ